MAVAPLELVPRVRDILGAFLFSGDAVEKPVRVLSGGEKATGQLAGLEKALKNTEAAMARFDGNKDGQLDRVELTANAVQQFLKMDLNNDRFLNGEEFKKSQEVEQQKMRALVQTLQPPPQQQGPRPAPAPAQRQGGGAPAPAPPTSG